MEITNIMPTEDAKSLLLYIEALVGDGYELARPSVFPVPVRDVA